MDHDRQSGEGVGPQEYMGIKCEVTSFGERAEKVKELVGGRKVFMVAATLRSETMYAPSLSLLLLSNAAHLEYIGTE